MVFVREEGVEDHCISERTSTAYFGRNFKPSKLPSERVDKHGLAKDCASFGVALQESHLAFDDLGQIDVIGMIDGNILAPDHRNAIVHVPINAPVLWLSIVVDLLAIGRN